MQIMMGVIQENHQLKQETRLDRGHGGHPEPVAVMVVLDLAQDFLEVTKVMLEWEQGLAVRIW